MAQFPFHVGEACISFAYLFLPFIFGFIHMKLKPANNRVEIYLYHTIFVGIAIQGILTGGAQIFKPEVVARIVGWPLSPFILELGMANLSFGILGLLSLWVKEWRAPASLSYGLFLFFTGIGHLIEIFQKGITPGNAQTFLFTDFLIPLVLFILLYLKRKKQKTMEPKIT